MTSTSFNIKPPERHFSARPPPPTRQGKSIPPKNNADFIGQYSINFTIKQNNKFESIFNSYSSKTLKNSAKSERKLFKPLSTVEISNIKLKFQQESQKRRERSLNTILFSHRQEQCEKKQRRRPSSRYRPNTAHQPSKSQLNNTQNQETFILSKQGKVETEDQKILLESTNFTVRSYSWQNKKETIQRPQRHQRKNSFYHSSLRTSKKGQTRQSNLLSRQELYQSTNNKPVQQPQIEIRLSLKSMSRSQQGQKVEKDSPQRTTMQKWIMEENRRLRDISQNDVKIKKEQVQMNPEKVRRQVLTGTTYKQNRMILKFDKRLLKNITQINDPCLKVSKISTISSRIKTQH